jgi:hypothetical protein
MKTVFKNKTFLYLLIGFISILILWNLYGGIINGNVWAIIPTAIEIVLLLFIFNRYEYARLMIILWAVIAFIAAPASGLLATLLDIGNDFIDKETGVVGVYGVILNIVQLIIGILILDYTRRTVKVEFPENESLNNID